LGSKSFSWSNRNWCSKNYEIDERNEREEKNMLEFLERVNQEIQVWLIYKVVMLIFGLWLLLHQEKMVILNHGQMLHNLFIID
jgi:hypothetical protein